jgi:hypothetical protein
MRDLLFVVGVGRSGTSLLQSMLNAHPAVCFAPETSFMRRFIATGLLDDLFRSAGPDSVVSLLQRDSLVARLGVAAGDMRNLVASQGDAFTATKLYRSLLAASCARKKDAIFLGDKDPRGVEFLKLMNKVFPNSYVAHIMRDPRDILVSKKKAQWSQRRSVLAHLFAHRVQERMGRDWGPRLFGSRYIELRYEELIAEPATVLERVCACLGLAFDPRMLEFASSSQELVAPDELDWKRETLGPLLASNRNKWLAELTPWEVALADAVCGDALQRNGYPPANQARPELRLAAGLVAGIAALADPLYRGYRSWRQA